MMAGVNRFGAVVVYVVGLLTLTVVASQNSCTKAYSSLLDLTDSTDVLITFIPPPNSIIRSISQRTFATRSDKISSLVNNLEENANESQKSVQEWLSKNNLEFKIIWITNQLYVPGANATVIAELCRFETVSEIRPDEQIPLDDIMGTKVQEGRREDNVIEWGVQRVRAEEGMVLIKDTGASESEVVVGIIDTGVRESHEALKDKFLGEYGWYF